MTASKEYVVTAEMLAAFDQPIAEAQIGLEVADQKLIRELSAAFANTERAERGFRHCLKRFGAEETVLLLKNEGLFGRTFFFGALRGDLLWFFGRVPGKVREALRDLPETIRDYALIERKLSDLVRARQCLQQRALGRPAPAPKIDRNAGRKRTR